MSRRQRRTTTMPTQTATATALRHHRARKLNKFKTTRGWEENLKQEEVSDVSCAGFLLQPREYPRFIGTTNINDCSVFLISDVMVTEVSVMSNVEDRRRSRSRFN